MPKINTADIGLIGLAVMGANLARNMADKKFHVSVFNRTQEKTEKFAKEFGNKFIHPFYDLKTFVNSLSIPRKIIIMVQAGEAVDQVINQLTPLLNKNDIIIDCGNSYYLDTERRQKNLAEKNIHLIGCGVSGGEEGALKGPSLMPGGDKSSYRKIENIFKKIAAKDFSLKPCVTFIGENGAGHFVKMVHNGIEYAVIQLMSESYDGLKNIYNLSAPEIAKIFAKLNKGKLKSYLSEIAIKVLDQKDEFHKNKYLIDFILDKASQKGTGRLTAITSLEKDSALSIITESVFARIISGEKEKREKLNKLYEKLYGLSSRITSKNIHPKIPLNNFISLIENSLYASIILAYVQGFELIQKVSKEQNWKINFAEISRIWQGGCIIRAELLKTFQKIYKNPKNKNKSLLEIPEIAKILKSSIEDLRKMIGSFTTNKVPKPALSSAINYFDSITSKNLPANFLQGLRDYFGAHTYERIDKKGTFHTKWN